MCMCMCMCKHMGMHMSMHMCKRDLGLGAAPPLRVLVYILALQLD